MTNLSRIAVHGVPRSGTSWVGEIINSSPNTIYKFQPLFSYALKDYLNSESTTEDIDRFFDMLVGTSDAFLDQEEPREEGSLPKSTKQEPTNVVYKEVRYHHLVENMLDKSSDVRLAAVIRNPQFNWKWRAL